MDEAKKGAVIGFLAGLAVALGGAIKDAPYEGFDVMTFIRSPVIGAMEGAILYERCADLPGTVGFFTVIGLERLTVELYKLYRAATSGYKPGKFEHGEWGVPMSMLKRR